MRRDKDGNRILVDYTTIYPKVLFKLKVKLTITKRLLTFTDIDLNFGIKNLLVSEISACLLT